MFGIGRPLRPVLLTACLLVGGCSLFGTSKPQPEPLPVPSGALKVVPAWSAALGAPSGVGFAPVVASDSVWAAAENGAITRLDLASGRVQWQVSVGKALTSGVGTDGSTAVVASRDGELIALGGDGSRKWAARLGGEVVTPPAVADGSVVLRTSDNRVLAFDVETGKQRWSFQRQNPTLVLRNSGGIAIAPGVAFVGMPGGRLVALTLANGAPRYDVPLAQPKGANELERIADVVGTPLVIGRDLCAVTYQGRIGCVEVTNGNPIWFKEFSSASGFDVDNRGLIAADADDTVQAFDRRGTPMWTKKGFARRRLSAPLITGSAVAFGDLQGNLLWLSRADGTLLAISRTDGKPIVAPAAAAGSTLVVQTSGGTLHAFRTE